MSHDHSSMSGMDMSGMDMGSSSSSSTCTMNMLGNWQVINTCFLTSSWHIGNTAQMVGSCFGVFLLVFLIENLRRWGREFDRSIVEKALSSERKKGKEGRKTSRAEKILFGRSNDHSGGGRRIRRSLRPTFLQQSVRSLIYGLQFTGAYLIMLIAMSFNGYMLISIVLGGLLGHFFSTWDTLGSFVEEEEEEEEEGPSMLEGPSEQDAYHPVGVDREMSTSISSSQESNKRKETKTTLLIKRDVHAGDIYGTGSCCG